jgi:putative transposase
MRTAYKCRAYPDPEQASVLNRTFGCVRVVWNRTLAWRHARYHGQQTRTDFAQANAYLTAMKASEGLDWLNEVSSVPLQQAIRHQQVAFGNFFAGRARYPRYKSRTGRQSAEYTRCQASLGHTALNRLPHSLADEIRAKLSDLSPVGAQSADRDSHRGPVGAT